MTKDPLDSVIDGLLPEIARALRPVVNGIYAAGLNAGYAKGVEEVGADFAKLLSAKASERLGASKSEVAATAATEAPAGDRPQSDYPTYGYGVVSTAVRDVMGKVGGIGIEAREIVTRLMDAYGLDVSILTVRDTLARLRGRGEVYCVKRTWFATDKLARELTLNDNGPPEGKPKDGPDTALGAQ